MRLNHPEYRAVCHPKHPPVGLRVVVDPMYFWDRTVLSERLARDGWNLVTRVKTKIAGRHPQKWEKPDSKLRRSLFLLDLNDGLDRRRPFHYVVVYKKTEAEIATFEADWADWDQRGRLAYTSQGKVWRIDFPPRGRPRQSGRWRTSTPCGPIRSPRLHGPSSGNARPGASPRIEPPRLIR